MRLYITGELTESGEVDMRPLPMLNINIKEKEKEETLAAA